MKKSFEILFSPYQYLIPFILFNLFLLYSKETHQENIEAKQKD